MLLDVAPYPSDVPGNETLREALVAAKMDMSAVILSVWRLNGWDRDRLRFVAGSCHKVPFLQASRVTFPLLLVVDVYSKLHPWARGLWRLGHRC